ncbi:MAG: B12-binding domain-containing radical SAM protein [Chloroflexi bacterium]|nr:B12-binding domain-containing radical SAM protein [Chloroflexota bacterium]
MDLLLAHGYFLDEDPRERQVMRPYPPLGMLYITSCLKARGFEVGVFDATFQTRRAFAEVLARERPPVVGLYATLLTRLPVLELIRECRQAGVRVVVGGPEPAQYAEEYLAAGADVVAVGEGEQTMEELLPPLLAGRTDLEAVRGVVFRAESGTLVRTPPRPFIKNLDAQPFPDREAVDLRAYLDVWHRYHRSSSVSLITARGCPYCCAWCSHAVFGESYRRRSPRNVAAEVEQIVERYRPDMVWYADDVFTIHHRWLFEYAALLKARGLRLPFECISRADRLSEEVVRTLAEMGCFRLWVGSESGSQRILDAMGRGVTVEAVQAAIALLRRYDIESGMFIMLGYEGEEPADLEATVAHLKGARPDIFLTTVAYPIKGTPYYRQVEDRLVARREWSARTERDWVISGRRSSRYYGFANRWMVGAVALDRERRAARLDPVAIARSAANVGIGRLGMVLTAGEVEGAERRPHEIGSDSQGDRCPGADEL